jgi:hypothetical protein
MPGTINFPPPFPVNNMMSSDQYVKMCEPSDELTRDMMLQLAPNGFKIQQEHLGM